MPLDRRSFLAALAAAGALLPAAAAAKEAPPPAGLPMGSGADHIGMLIYPGFTALDFVGPFHFLAGMGDVQVHVVTNQSDLSPVPSDQGLMIQPTATMADCPDDLAVIFVPGGTIGTIAAAKDPATLAFVRERGARARYVTSVCTGSLVLGAAGLLGGRRATSHWSVVEALSQFGATPVRERIVRDGNVITGAGVSAGLDFGVTLVEELRDRFSAEAAVLISEYAPQPPLDGGTIESARPEVAEMLQQALAPFTAEAGKLSL
jgi:putative intracellular protease/amidase